VIIIMQFSINLKRSLLGSCKQIKPVGSRTSQYKEQQQQQQSLSPSQNPVSPVCIT
jgi:hypothetical protein